MALSDQTKIPFYERKKLANEWGLNGMHFCQANYHSIYQNLYKKKT